MIRWVLAAALLTAQPAQDADLARAEALHDQGQTNAALTLLLNAGQSAVKDGEVERGIVLLERAIELRPGLASSHAAFGHACLQADRHHDAVQHLTRALELGETNPMATLFLGAALWESGDYNAAESAYGGLAGSTGPAAAAARSSLGALRVFRGEYEAAIAPLAAALGEMPGSVQVRYDLARALEGAGRDAEAMELFAAALEQDPAFLQAHYRLARLHQAAGEPRRAAHHLERFEQLHAEHQRATREEGRVGARVKQARALYHGGDEEAATSAIERLLAAEPERLDLRLLLDEWRLGGARP